MIIIVWVDLDISHIYKITITIIFIVLASHINVFAVCMYEKRCPLTIIAYDTSPIYFVVEVLTIGY